MSNFIEREKILQQAVPQYLSTEVYQYLSTEVYQYLNTSEPHYIITVINYIVRYCVLYFTKAKICTGSTL